MDNRLTPAQEKTVKRNFLLVIVITMFTSVIITVCGTGTADVYVYAYLQKLGFSASGIGVLSSVGQIGCFAGCILFVNYNTYRKNAITVYTICRLALILVPLYLLLTARADVRSFLFIAVLLVIKFVQQLGQSLHNIANTTMKRRILPVERIVKVEGLSNILNSGLNVLLSAGFAMVIAALAFPDSYLLIFGIAIAAAVIAMILQTRYTPVFSHETPELTNETFFASIRRLSKDPIMRALILPSILRSFSVCFAFISVIAAKRFGDDFVQPGIITAVTQLGTVLGTIALVRLSKRFPIGKLIRVGAIIGYAFLLVMCLTTSTVLFYAALFLAYIGQTQVETGIPIGMQVALPEHLVGAAIGIRMSINSLCQAVTLALMGVMLDSIPPYLCVIAYAIPYVIGVRGFHRAFLIAKQETEIRNAAR